MLPTLVLATLLIASSMATDVAHNKDLLGAIKKVCETATNLMDYETRKDFYIVQRRIESVLRNTEFTNEQLMSAIKLVKLISRRMEDGKIRLHNIKRFIAFALSNRLKKLLTTWNTELLKLH